MNSRPGECDRLATLEVLQHLAEPVLTALSENRLRKELPRKDWETEEGNVHTSGLQAFGRLLSGLAPWFSLGQDGTEESVLRIRYLEMSIQGLIHATDPDAPDYLFDKPTDQRIVHAAYIAYPLLVAKQQLWEPLTPHQQIKVIEALKTHRAFKPYENNWVLFSAILECAIWELTGECEIGTIETGVQKHMDWYLGDGTYGDGPNLHWDYYNSYVIQPLLLETLRTCQSKGHPLGDLLPLCLNRANRYAEILEHLISPEGTFPVIGRSSVYRYAVFQHIGYVGFRFGWPEALDPGATRSALTTVIRRMHEAPGTFDKGGWLTAGVVGHQAKARDVYNFTGALYMCTMGLTHLGLPSEHPFWSSEPGPWFQQRVWSGQEIPNQHSYDERANP